MPQSKQPQLNTPLTFRITDFSGGQNTTVSPSLLNDNEAVKAENVSLMQKGTISPRRGRKKRYPAPFSTSPVTGMGAYYKKDGTSRLLVTAGDKVYYDEPHIERKWSTKADWETGTLDNISTSLTDGDLKVPTSEPVDLKQITDTQAKFDAGEHSNTVYTPGTGKITGMVEGSSWSVPSHTSGRSYGWAFRPRKDLLLVKFRIYQYTNYVQFRLWNKDTGEVLRDNLSLGFGGAGWVEIDVGGPWQLKAGVTYMVGVYYTSSYNGKLYKKDSVQYSNPRVIDWIGAFKGSGDVMPTTEVDYATEFMWLAINPVFQDDGFIGLTKSDETNYNASGEWTSPVFDTQGKDPASTKVSWVNKLVPTGASVAAQMRTSPDNVTWSGWSEVTNGGAFPAKQRYSQVKLILSATPDLKETPTVTSVSLEALQAITPATGTWTSPPVDVSQAKDKSTGKLSVGVTIGTGSLNIQSRSSADSGVTWSEWADALPDGTLQHPANNHIQVRLVLNGTSVVVHDATLALDGTPTATQLLTGMTPGAEYDFATLKDTIIIVNGKDAPRKWDGTNPPATLTDNPPPFAFIETHQNRLWAAGDPETPSRLRFSDILNPDKWDALNFIDFNPEDGDKITGILRYGSYLVVSKARSMAILTGDRTANYSVTWLEGEVGAQGPKAICGADKYLAFVAQDGIRFSDLTNSIVATNRLMPSWEKINHRRLNQAAMVFWNNLLLVALPKEGSLVNNTVWCFDFLRNSWTIYEGWNVSCWTRFHQYGEDILLASDSTTGQVYQVFAQERDDDSPVFYTWQSKDFTFDYPERMKLFRNVFLDVEGIADEAPLTVTFFVDGQEKGSAQLVVPAGTGIMHSFRLLPPVFDAVLGQRLAIRIVGRNGIHGIAIEVIVRGAVPGGL